MTAAFRVRSPLAMQRELTLVQNRYTLTENPATSLKALYAQRRPQQQETADQLVPRLLPLVLQPARGGLQQPPRTN
ncbi:MAG: hypothetical protein ACXWC6_02485 [Ramlibacter sp.]